MLNPFDPIKSNQSDAKVVKSSKKVKTFFNILLSSLILGTLDIHFYESKFSVRKIPSAFINQQSSYNDFYVNQKVTNVLIKAPMQRDEPRQSNNPRNMPGVDKRQRNINAGGDGYDQYERPQAVSIFLMPSARRYNY